MTAKGQAHMQARADLTGQFRKEYLFSEYTFFGGNIIPCILLTPKRKREWSITRASAKRIVQIV